MIIAIRTLGIKIYDISGENKNNPYLLQQIKFIGSIQKVILNKD